MSTPSKLVEDHHVIADRYLVEANLGEGGMGTIYRVLDRATDARLALKCLKLSDNASSETRVTHFQREYHTLKQLAHPRIIRVYDFGFADGSPYYTMELLDGQDMRELAPLEWSRACALLRDIASSLAIVHSRKLVYRDVSPRNVRCTSDGRAKLLDFGALTPIGVPSHVVGTPSFMPPEAIFEQPLDQRSDLYSLGALAYWLLTGVAPYPVRHLNELRDAWRSRPAAPSKLVRSIPEPLSALVMSLLAHNPTGRPQHAGEVIDKLTAIAQLPPEIDLGVMRAYLTTPDLVGRDDEVLRIRKALVRATRGRGSALLVRAASGLGSTRLIDACVLEGKLVGALVARADADDCANEEFAAVRAAIDQWADGLPERQAQQLRAAAVKHSATTTADDLVVASGTRAEGTHARIATAILRVARERALVLAVNDADLLDHASVAVFALLARTSGTHKLLVYGSLPEDAELRDSLPLRMLVEATQPVHLNAWTQAQTEALLRSLFGSVPNVPLLADRIHRVALGNPRDTMQLAQHVIDAGIVRHQAGAWVLPTALGEIALPRNMAQTQHGIIDALSADCQELAAMLALVPDLAQLDLSDCARLSPDTLPLIDILIRHGVLVQRGTGFAFRHRGFAAILTAASDEGQRRASHLRLVAMHEAAGHHPLTVAYHLHHAGEVEACIQKLRLWLAQQGGERLSPERAELIEAIVDDSEHYVLPGTERHRLRSALVQHASLLDPAYGRHGEQALEQLRHDTGLVYWDDYPELESSARIGRCLERAMAAYQSTPEMQRGVAPFDAVRELAVLVRSMASVYARTLASEKLLAIAGWLIPFRGLAPAIQLLYDVTVTSGDRAVREKRVAHRYLEFATKFQEPIQGLDDTTRRQAAAIFVYLAAMDEAKQGKASALERVVPLEKLDHFAALAWHVRMLSHIYHGRSLEAASCRERMELLVIEQNRPITLLAMSVLYEAWGYELCEDLLGLKAALEQVEQEAKRYPGWQPWAVIYRGDVNRLRGDSDAAFACYEQAVAMTAPGRHQVWPHASERLVGALRQLGRIDESVALGRNLLQFAQDEDLEPVNILRIYVTLALSEAAAGALSTAHDLMAAARSRAELEGIGGVSLGIVHEADARLAVLGRDAAAFEQASAACASYLLAGDNPALTAKYERLLQDADAAGLIQASAKRENSAPSDPALTRLQTVSNYQERAEAVLELVSTQYRAGSGCLFSVTAGGSQVTARKGGLVVSEQLCSMVDDFLTAELSDVDMVTVTRQDERSAQGSPNVWTVDTRDTYLPVLLRGRHENEVLVVGVAVVEFSPLFPVSPDQRLLDALGQALLDCADGAATRGRLEAG